MKTRVALAVAVSVTLTGCSGQQVWVLKKSETAIMDYAAIVPLRQPEGKVVAKMYGGYEERRYEVPLEQEYLNAYVKTLLANKGNRISVQEGVLVIRNSEGGKLRVGGMERGEAESLGIENLSVDRNGGVFLGPPPEKSKGLVTTLLGWIF